jgi:hypothetical protein
MIVGFTGTQRGMTKAQRERLTSDVFNAIHIDEFRHGDCEGADETASRIANDFNVQVIIHPPLDPKKRAFCIGHTLTPKPYLERNHDIVDACNLLIATPGQKQEQLRSGTWATIRYATKKGKPVLIIYPDGTRERRN